MTEIYAMSQEHKFWGKTLQMAAKCSWKAGPFLSEKMVKNGKEFSVPSKTAMWSDSAL